jgi:5'-nucleotidase
MVKLLKGEGAHIILCLSHLGYEYPDSKVSDRVLANQVDGIDLIIGGHTHTFLEKPELVTRGKSKTLICQAGWAGLAMGRIDVKIDTKKVYFWNDSYTHF